MTHLRILLLVSIAVSFFALFPSQVVEAEPPSPFAAALAGLQNQIGYEFRAVDLLRRAMTHPSYSRENCRTLSILGLDAIRSSAALRLLLGDIDASAAAMNGRIEETSGVEACAAFGKRLGIEKVVRVSPKTNSSAPAVVCGAFRALFGGIAVDSGKIDAAGEVFWRVYGGGGAAIV